MGSINPPRATLGRFKVRTQLGNDRGDCDTSIEVFKPSNMIEKGQVYWALDLLIQRAVFENSEASLYTIRDGRSDAIKFLGEALDTAMKGDVAADINVIRYIFARHNGQLLRNDLVHQRFECCEDVSRISSFILPSERVLGSEIPSLISKETDLVDLLDLAIGAIQIQIKDESQIFTALDTLERETLNRLSFPWILETPQICRYRVAWVQGREDIDSIRRAYEAAKALGITLVIIDESGHWLEDDNGPHASLREAFVPLNIDPDEEFPGRVVEAIKSYPLPIDGVVTISDVRLPGIAKACEILGLSTSPSNAYEIAGDKARTRLLELDANESFIVHSTAELREHLTLNGPPSFPLIVKPCIGWCSDCVSKVSNEKELVQAVEKASARHEYSAKSSTTVVIEPYISGPEVDANFVLLDGEVLFSEINDDFPSKGDSSAAGLEDNFQETQNVMPSALPEDELTLIRDSLHRSILRQGFTTGVFHCEARVRYSSVSYSSQADTGVVDLALLKDQPQQKAAVYLHEINARPPGYLESVATTLVYGVDYYAIRLLLSLGSREEARIRALAQPFRNGPQFHLSAMIIPQTRAGIMKTADATKDFLSLHPKIEKLTVDYKTRKLGGEILEGPTASALWWIAYLSVVSRQSRQELLETVEYIQDNFTYEIVEE